jgi:hypothetical protein
MVEFKDEGYAEGLPIAIMLMLPVSSMHELHEMQDESGH